MSRMKISKTASKSEKSKSKDWPVVVYLWIFGLIIIGYVVARMVFDGYPHSYHWWSALVGGIVGIPIGWLWYRWRGDVF